MRNIKIIIQYDGSRYNGWQRLGDSDKTIQGKLEQVLSRMTGEDIKVIGSGRTDAGVHALRQTANFKTGDPRPVEDIQNYLNQYLPDDIAVVEAMEVPERFHSRLNALSKTYVYRVWNQPYPHPFLRKYSLYIPQPFLKVKAMNKAAQYLIGEHDFTSFASGASKKKSNVRMITDIRFVKNDGMLEISIDGDGFLYNMVRIIIGTLLEVGLGNITPETVKDMLDSLERQKSGPTAPPQGLFLADVRYPDEV